MYVRSAINKLLRKSCQNDVCEDAGRQQQLALWYLCFSPIPLEIDSRCRSLITRVTLPRFNIRCSDVHSHPDSARRCVEWQSTRCVRSVLMSKTHDWQYALYLVFLIAIRKYINQLIDRHHLFCRSVHRFKPWIPTFRRTRIVRVYFWLSCPNFIEFCMLHAKCSSKSFIDEPICGCMPNLRLNRIK